MARRLLLILLICCVGLCANAQSGKAFRLPDVPDSLRTPGSRADFLVMHYWDNYDFSDTTLLTYAGETEQAFVNFINILRYSTKTPEAVDALYRRASVETMTLRHFIELGDKYLYEPNSPMHNEDLHILMLQAIINNPQIREEEKIRPRFLLETALKNRPGSIAADFTAYLHDDTGIRLSAIEAEYTLIFFNDPECHDCLRVKERLAYSPHIRKLVDTGRLKILSVCVEGRTPAWETADYPKKWINCYDKDKSLTICRTYDLKAIPTLYLLDSGKHVILKDASIGSLIERLLAVPAPSPISAGDAPECSSSTVSN
ncbi:MAG: DUF5106 domain-containing protein [Candidatus Egerieousia sp.]